MKKWLKRIGLAVVALVAIVIAVGAVVEQLDRRRAVEKFPPLGKLVDIGGRRIQIDCRGSGSPVVVFESGSGLFGSLDWSNIQDKVAATTRACSYSRAGIMWSDPAKGVRDGKAIASDLDAVLEKVGERPPFVLVGHSLGGPYVVAFTHYFGAEVAGLVLVDPAHPDMFRRIKAIARHDIAHAPPILRILAKLSWTGVLRLFFPPQDAKNAYLPTSLDAYMKGVEATDETLAEMGASHDLGARPLYVLTSSSPYSEADLPKVQISQEDNRQFKVAWKEMHDDIASWSTASQHLLVPDSSHFIQVDKPDVVIHAVESVIEAVRSSAAPLP